MDELEAEPQGPAVQVEVDDRVDGTVLVRIAGEMDMSNIDELEDRLEPALARSPQRLIIDASGLTFADSSAIALWVRWAAKAGHVELRDAPPLIRRVLTAMGLDVILGVAP